MKLARVVSHARYSPPLAAAASVRRRRLAASIFRANVLRLAVSTLRARPGYDGCVSGHKNTRIDKTNRPRVHACWQQCHQLVRRWPNRSVDRTVGGTITGLLSAVAHTSIAPTALRQTLRKEGGLNALHAAAAGFARPCTVFPRRFKFFEAFIGSADDTTFTEKDILICRLTASMPQPAYIPDASRSGMVRSRYAFAG